MADVSKISARVAGDQRRSRGGMRALTRRPVLDPFAVGRRSLRILEQELRALNRPRLLTIIAAYDLAPLDEDIAWMSDPQLARFIVVAVEARLGVKDHS